MVFYEGRTQKDPMNEDSEEMEALGPKKRASQNKKPICFDN